MPDLAATRQELNEDRDRLRARLKDLGIDVDGGAKAFGDDEGFADSGSVTAEKGELMTLAESLRENLEDIEGALQRLDKGTYGKCESCGQDIPKGRLEVLPATDLCLECASAART